MTARLNLRLGLFAIVAFVVGLVAARWLIGPTTPPPPALDRATVFAPRIAVAPFDLVDEDGRPFDAASLRGQWSIVFFGFTHCPDVCPTTLAVLKQLRGRLGDLPPQRQPRVLLFTVDPERDTPAQLREYVRFFDPSFHGVTGSPAGVQAAASAFGVPFARVSLPQGGYTMDHGAGLHFVSPDGRKIAYASPPFSAEALARDYRKLETYYAETSE